MIFAFVILCILSCFLSGYLAKVVSSEEAFTNAAALSSTLHGQGSIDAASERKLRRKFSKAGEVDVQRRIRQRLFNGGRRNWNTRSLEVNEEDEEGTDGRNAKGTKAIEAKPLSLTPNIINCTELIIKKTRYITYLLQAYDSQTLPSCLGDVTSLVSLNLSVTDIQGTIPSSLGKLKHLQILDLSGNSLIGTVPESLGKLKALQTLLLSRNSLNGPLPESIGNLTKLECLGIYQTQLTGWLTI
jgi:hypothetical protein